MKNTAFIEEKAIAADKSRHGEIFPRILPFALFMAFIGAEELVRFLSDRELVSLGERMSCFLYPVRTLAAAMALVSLWKRYSEVRLRDLSHYGHSLASVFVGLLVFVLWINMDFTFGFQTQPKGFNPTVFENNVSRWLVTAIRLAGSALVVPVMEELFWRSFLMRYLVKSDFEAVPIGLFTWSSFLFGSVLFGLEHHFILAGIMAGIFYNLLLYYTKSISQCILSHGITNLALGVYVLDTGNWHFW